MERQADHGQPVLRLVWDHDAISRRRSGIAFYEATERTEYLAPAWTAAHDPTGGGRGIRYGGGNQSQFGADVEQTRSTAGFCAYPALLPESKPRLHECECAEALYRRAFHRLSAFGGRAKSHRDDQPHARPY